MCLPRMLLYLSSAIAITMAWPDGAPCIHSVFESMNPLEAVEHQGGLQLTDPPYRIDVREKCYWMNQPVELSLKGNTSTDRFRGFAIQPFSYKGPNRGRRIGQFLRLDDNGSWQQQCFRFKDSVTHSHDEKKKNIKLWWKNEFNDDDYVQFVATVVKSQKVFWVKAVKSVPIPPCRFERNGIQDYVPDPVTPPPMAKQFKLETFRMFDAVDDNLQHNLLEVVPNDADRSPKPQKIQDFFRVMRISDRLRTKAARPQTPATQALVPATVTLPPAAPQTAPDFVARLPLPPQPQFIRQIAPVATAPLPPQPQFIRQIAPVATAPSPQTPQIAPAFSPPQLPQPVPAVNVFATTSPPQPLIPAIAADSPLDNQVQASALSPQTVQPAFERLRLTHTIPASSLATVQQPPVQFLSSSNQAIIVSAQQQPIQSEFRVSPQAMHISQRIFVRPIRPPVVSRPASICADVDPPALCISRISFCNTRQYMRLNCQRTCRFC